MKKQPLEIKRYFLLFSNIKTYTVNEDTTKTILEGVFSSEEKALEELKKIWGDNIEDAYPNDIPRIFIPPKLFLTYSLYPVHALVLPPILEEGSIFSQESIFNQGMQNLAFNHFDKEKKMKMETETKLNVLLVMQLLQLLGIDVRSILTGGMKEVLKEVMKDVKPESLVK